jgi:hypothetical protein
MNRNNPDESTQEQESPTPYTLSDFQPWLAKRLARWQTFMADPTPGWIMVNLATWDMDLPLDIEDRPLESWSFPGDCGAFADHQIRRLRAELRLTRDIDDDRLPLLNPGIGIALNSLYYADGKMDVSAGTTWRHPVIHTWDDLSRLRCDPANPWFQGISAMNRRFVGSCDGDYCVQTFSHFAPMDMANALRGNDLFTDFYDSPSEVHALMQKSVEATLWLEHEQRQIVPRVDGGTVIWGSWVPDRAVFMSEDATDLCAPEVYREFGKPYTEQISAAGGGCWIHHHAKGFHVQGEVAKVSGLRMVELSWDPNCPRPVDCLERLFAENAGLPLMTRCTARDVYEKIDIMKQGRLVLMLTADSLEEAREALAFVRKHTGR